MGQIAGITLAGISMLVGLVGTIVPIIPGVPFMFLVALIYALITKFAILTGAELGYLAILVVSSIFIDYFAGLLGAKFSGASGKSLLVGTFGFLLGLILFPPFGGFIGMFVGIVTGEIYFFNKPKTAIRAASGGVLGTLAGMVLNFLLGLTFVSLFLVFVL
ncbi:MAG: DUF456 domain-containing protein [Patescibacteria group bacterium]